MTILMGASAIVPGLITLDNLAAEAPFDDLGAATTTYRVTVTFEPAGVCRIVRANNADTTGIYYAPASATSNLWVRVTNTATPDLNGSSDTRGVWHQLNVNRDFELEYTSSGGLDFISSTNTIEIASDSLGANIIDSKTLLVWNAGENI